MSNQITCVHTIRNYHSRSLVTDGCYRLERQNLIEVFRLARPYKAKRMLNELNKILNQYFRIALTKRSNRSHQHYC